MKLTNINQVNEFLDIVNKCQGEVALISLQGDKFNLKSTLTQYVAIGAILGEHGDELELFCSNKEDEAMFIKFLKENPEVR